MTDMSMHKLLFYVQYTQRGWHTLKLLLSITKMNLFNSYHYAHKNFFLKCTDSATMNTDSNI